jgi:hypothetical protein
MEKFRLKSAANRWAASGVAWRPWISLEAVALWEAALARAKEQGKPEPAELARAVELARGLETAPSSSARCTLPMSEQQRQKAAESMDQLQARLKQGASGYRDLPWQLKSLVQSAFDQSSRTLSWEAVVEQGKALKHFEDQCSSRSPMDFVALPDARWTERPSQAHLMNPVKARDWVDQAARCQQLSGLLTKARAQAKKLGFSEAGWSGLFVGTLGKTAQELTTAAPEPFNPAEELDERQALALYVTHEKIQGFLDKNGQVRNDLSEALIFATPKMAKAFARRKASHVAGVYAVRVSTSVISYEPLQGAPLPAPALGEAVAQRERKELAGALRMAQIEELEAELEERKREREKERKLAKGPSGRL